MDPSLLGKRKKKVKKSPNPLFVKWLTEWRDEAAEKGWKSQYTYAKALKSLKKYPLPIATGKDCKFLENIGDKTCKMLDKKLAEHVAQYGTADPVGCTDSGEDTPSPPKKPKTSKASRGSVNFEDRVMLGATASHSNSDVGGLSVPPPPDDGRAAQPRQRRRTNSNHREREYIPQFRSGPYALIITLYRDMQRPDGRGFMTKAALMRYAQPLAEKSFTIPDPGSKYTAWSSMGTLINKGFVVKESNPAKYSLTDKGCELAHKLLAVDASNVVSSNTQSGNLATSSIGNLATNQGSMMMNVGVATVGPSASSAVVHTGHSSGPGIGSSSYTGQQSSEDISEPDVPEITFGRGVQCSNKTNQDDEKDGYGNVPWNMDARPQLCFVYINDEGEQVHSKDGAAVLIEDDFLGFLCKCSYSELLDTAFQYRLDDSRPSLNGEVYAYLHNEDAPEQCTKAVGYSNVTGKTKPPPRNEKNLKSMSAKHNTTSHKTCILTNAQVTSTATHTTTTLYPSEISIESSEENSQSSVSSMKSSASIQSNRSYKPGYTLPRYIHSESQNSEENSQESTSSSKSQLVSKFTLNPGMFDVVLCVDNAEHYGGARSKQELLPELAKNGINFVVRKLKVGDFLWIAREKPQVLPGQLAPRKGREVVLDYIIERKRMDDLAGSIVDGRFKEQKFRLRNCGLRRPIYLVEDYGSADHYSIKKDALQQAIVNTQVTDGFYVKRTRDTRESVAYLTLMTRYLTRYYQTKTLVACCKNSLDECQEEYDIESSQQRLLEFEEFNHYSVKNKALTVKELFGKHLMQLHGVSGEKAQAIVEQYGSVLGLVNQYEQCQNEKEKELLLSKIKFGPLSRNIGAAISKTVYQLYNTAGALC